MKDPALTRSSWLCFTALCMIIFLLLFVFKHHHFLLEWKMKISVWRSSLNFKESTSSGSLSISESKDHWFQFFGKKKPHWFLFFQKPQRIDGFHEGIGKRRKVLWSVLWHFNLSSKEFMVFMKDSAKNERFSGRFFDFLICWAAPLFTKIHSFDNFDHLWGSTYPVW